MRRFRCAARQLSCRRLEIEAPGIIRVHLLPMQGRNHETMHFSSRGIFFPRGSSLSTPAAKPRVHSPKRLSMDDGSTHTSRRSVEPESHRGKFHTGRGRPMVLPFLLMPRMTSPYFWMSKRRPSNFSCMHQLSSRINFWTSFSSIGFRSCGKMPDGVWALFKYGVPCSPSV